MHDNIGGLNDDFAKIKIAHEFLIKYVEDPITNMVEYIYPSIATVDDDPSYLKKRTILAPTLDVVDFITGLSLACPSHYTNPSLHVLVAIPTHRPSPSPLIDHRLLCSYSDCRRRC
ncbi:unnamed protein product [Cuscuta europaea]|uniref:Uncharacterized protein n=1 Tax=Cuscuta europaea TaxID=41803 RepID=A0A9P0Z4M5_CUSEU|nr:unnamed protein product [Cuscuta europaea]